MDFAENARNGDGSGFDMGAYEYVCSSPVAGTAATSDATICSGTTGALTVSGETARSINGNRVTDNPRGQMLVHLVTQPIVLQLQH